MTIAVELAKLLAMVAVFALCMPLLVLMRWGLIGTACVLQRAKRRRSA